LKDYWIAACTRFDCRKCIGIDYFESRLFIRAPISSLASSSCGRRKDSDTGLRR